MFQRTFVIVAAVLSLPAIGCGRPESQSATEKRVSVAVHRDGKKPFDVEIHRDGQDAKQGDRKVEVDLPAGKIDVDLPLLDRRTESR